MGILERIKQRRTMQRYSNWKEYGGYRAAFTSFGSDLYASELVRSCIRPLAEFTSKARATSTDKRVETILTRRPNLYMNGPEFLKKVRTYYELRNNCFILIDRDDRGRAIGFYPVPYAELEGLEYKGRLFIKFAFRAEREPLIVAWEDLAVVRKDYNQSDIVGDDNAVLIRTLQLLTTLNEGLSNAVKATANLRGILKSTKSMLSDEDRKKLRDGFVSDYMNLENEGGIASLDATQEFTPIEMKPTIANAEQMNEFREAVYRYFGVNEKIIASSMSSDEIEAFYELRVEPFLVDLSEELTAKVFSQRQQSFDNHIIYEANKLQFASISKKADVFSKVVLYGGMTINEWRLGCNLPPVEWGDDPIIRLDAAQQPAAGQGNNNEGSDENADQE